MAAAPAVSEPPNRPSSPTAAGGGGGGRSDGIDRGRKPSFWNIEPFGEDHQPDATFESITMGDFAKTGTLYKKRGGFFRNVPQQNWVPRTFGLTHKGKLLYYEAATIQEAAASAGGLGQPRQHLDLGKEGCTWATPSNETDGHTKYMLVVTHDEKSVDNGQRLKLCANTEAELLGWVEAITPFSKRDDKAERPLSPTRRNGGVRRGSSGRGGSFSGNMGRHRSTSQEIRRSSSSSSSSSSTGGGGGGRGRGNREVAAAVARRAAYAAKAGPFGAAGGVMELAALLVCLNACAACIYLSDPTSPSSSESSLSDPSSGEGSISSSSLQYSSWRTCLPAVVLLNAAVVAALLRAQDRARHLTQLAADEYNGLFLGAGSGGGAGGVDDDGGSGGVGVGGGGLSGSSSGGGGGGVKAPTKVVTPGQTIKRLVPPEEGGVFPPGEKLEMPSFGPGDKNDFQLRTVGYKKHGIKAASSEPLYELVALDMFKTNRRVDRIYGNLDLASLNLPDTAHPDVPALFVMNVQFPREEQKLFSDGDGAGASVVFYFKITPTTLAQLQGPMAERSPALQLLTEWCRVAPDDPNFRGRFKCMGFIDRIQDYGLPGVAARFNGKPILIKKTGSLYRGQAGPAGFIEMDINVHRFAYATRACLIGMKEKFGSMVIKCGFTIEGREDEELPEVLLGCGIINGVDLDSSTDLF